MHLFLTSMVALVASPPDLPDASLTTEEVAEIRQECNLSEKARLVDGRSVHEADDLLHHLSALGDAPTILHGASLAGESVKEILEELAG